jgi:shikimate kinase
MTAIYIGGLSGIGKTSVGNEFAKKVPGFRFIDGSDVFRIGTGQEPPGVASLPQLKALNDELLLGILHAEGKLVLAGHFFISQHLLAEFDLICFLSVPSKVLVARRAHDEFRQRSTEIKVIRREFMEMYTRLCSLIEHCDIPCLLIPALKSPDKIVDNILLHIAQIGRVDIVP